MKLRLLYCLLVFTAVFLIGFPVMYLKHRQSHIKPVKNIRTEKILHEPEKIAMPMPPLTFPEGTTLTRGVKGSWEYIGTIPQNYVTARTGICVFFRRQNWIPAKRIKLDESLHPMELLTFHQDKYSLLLQIWRINTITTGFACRRFIAEKQEKAL